MLACAFACLLGVWLIPGRAPATIAEQRARLPPAAECDDEQVAGIWRSHAFTGRRREWYVFTLFIERVAEQPNQLVGRITSHFWIGDRADEEPPACERQRYQFVVSFDARGTVTDDLHIAFGGVGQWHLDRNPCGARMSGYNLDNFTGVIDPSILEFQSVNNDGGAAVNDPTVFRRIRCPPQRSAQSPSVNPIPPAFYPERLGGCGR